MNRVLEWVQGFALAMGGPGLFVIAFLDSSFLSFPEVVDILIIWLVTQHKSRFVYYALLPTLGSIAGCFALYWVARRGGETFLRKRLHERHVERTLALFQKYGLLAIAIPSILPPPFPFKAFVLAAGVARVRPFDFGLAVTFGRGIRYFGAALLALWYGERAAAYLQENVTRVSIAVGIAVIGLAVLTMWWRRRHSVDASSGGSV
jgi:membrane protein YqaA with SNARE-associated domain